MSGYVVEMVKRDLWVIASRTDLGGNIEDGHGAGPGSKLGQGNVYGAQATCSRL